MTVNQFTPRHRISQAVRRAVRALKPIYGEQTAMWEAFWRSNRFPAD